MVQGVLVVQTVERRSFSPNEIRMLVTVGSQLAPLVSGARMLERVAAAADEAEALGHRRTPPGAARCSNGCPLSPGTGLGQAYLIGQDVVLGDAPDTLRGRPRDRKPAAGPGPWRLPGKRSPDSAAGSPTWWAKTTAAILQAQLMILQDSTVERDLAALPGRGRQRPRGPCHAPSDKYVATFQKLANPFFRERIFDIKDVFRRVFWHLRPQADGRTLGEERLVLVAHEASVLDLFSVDLDHLVGVVVEHGGPHSHAVIIARSLGIPMVGQVSGLIDQIEPGQLLRIDGSTGQIELDPSVDVDGRRSRRRRTPSSRLTGNGRLLGHGSRPARDAAHRGQRQPPERGRSGRWPAGPAASGCIARRCSSWRAEPCRPRKSRSRSTAS